jgi:hypothetical protein
MQSNTIPPSWRADAPNNARRYSTDELAALLKVALLKTEWVRLHAD